MPLTLKRFIFATAPIGVDCASASITTTLSPVLTPSHTASSWPSTMLNDPGVSESTLPRFILSASTDTFFSSAGITPRIIAGWLRTPSISAWIST
jgi:hypothetical protein